MESRPKRRLSKGTARVESSHREMFKVKRSILQKLFARVGVGAGRKNK
jgi:hypothetical protein